MISKFQLNDCSAERVIFLQKEATSGLADVPFRVTPMFPSQCHLISARCPRVTALNRICSEIASSLNSEEIVAGKYKPKVSPPRISVRKIDSLRLDHCAISEKRNSRACI